MNFEDLESREDVVTTEVILEGGCFVVHACDPATLRPGRMHSMSMQIE